ncbi:MAG: hypothetical protein NZM25_09945 [Leptospiraceae bacterium]|nr:hypothetical protein [Leptospiraceae bacterium]MDW8307470.1 hypothetical protein [Leptospiraceae bacterium]
MRVAITISFVFFISISRLEASWAILPVRVEGETLPNLSGFELSRLAVLYLEYGGIYAVTPVSLVERAYRKFELTSSSPLPPNVAVRLAQELDCERLLLLLVKKTAQGYRWESLVFYPESLISGDPIEIENPSLWDGLGELLRRRFPHFRRPISHVKPAVPVIFLIELSAANQREIEALSEMLVPRGGLYGVCAVSAAGEIKESPFPQESHEASLFLKRLRTEGSTAAQHLSKAVFCAESQIKRRQLTKVIFYLLVGSAPRDEGEKNRLKGYMRQLASKGEVHVLGSGSLSFEERNFYEDLTRELSSQTKSEYHDILYRKKMGLSTGESWYVFKRGFHLLESQNQDATEAFSVSVPAHLRQYFHPERLSEMYRKLSQNQILSEGRLEVAIPSLIAKSEEQKEKRKGFARILLEFPEGQFWFTIPHRLKKPPSLGETVSLALLLTRGRYGIPVENDPAFVKIYENYADVPQSLLLNLKDYLKNPEKYLDKSIGKTSLYILTGRLREIRLKQADIYE